MCDILFDTKGKSFHHIFNLADVTPLHSYRYQTIYSLLCECSPKDVQQACIAVTAQVRGGAVGVECRHGQGTDKQSRKPVLLQRERSLPSMNSTLVSSVVDSFAVPDAAAIVGNGRLCRYSMMPSSRHSSALLSALEPLQACMQGRGISKTLLVGSCCPVCIAAVAVQAWQECQLVKDNICIMHVAAVAS